MSLIDKLASTLLDTGKSPESHDELVAPFVSIIEKEEGLAGLYDLFLHHEFDGVIKSWASGGEVPSTAKDVEAALSPALISDYANKLGIAPNEAADRLAENMPRYIDELIEKGEWPKPVDYVDTAVEIMKTRTID